MRTPAAPIGWSTCVLAVALSVATFAGAQAVPAVINPLGDTGFQLPTVGGSLRYSLTGSESVLFGYNGLPGTGVNSLTDVSGDLAYLSKSERHPFSAVYSGGYLFGTSNEPSYAFQNLALSQVVKTRNWTFTAADAVSYLPQSPVTGLSGIPGTGDLNIPPVTVGPDSGLGILTEYGTRVTNIASGTATRLITAGTSVSATGSDVIQRFISAGSTGINNDQLSGGGSLTHRFDSRTSLSGGYTYATSSFSGPAVTQNLGFNTQTVIVTYNRQLARSLALTVGAGPQHLAGSGGSSAITQGSTSIAANAGLTYGGRRNTASLIYVRGINNGTGVVVGSRSDVISFTAGRGFSRVWSASGTVSYNRSVALANTIYPSFSSSAEVAGGQISRRFGRALSGFTSYTLQRQSFTGTATGLNAFNGLTQILTVGITYAPSPLLGRR